MKDETAGAGGASFDDFDLDSFLKENNFLDSEDPKDGAGGAKADTEQSQRQALPDRTSSRRVAAGKTRQGETPKEPLSGAASKSESASRLGGAAQPGDSTPKQGKGSSSRSLATRTGRTGKADPNATMSYEALGEDYPEIPLVGTGSSPARPSRRPASSAAIAAADSLAAGGAVAAGKAAGASNAVAAKASAAKASGVKNTQADRDRTTTSPTPRKASSSASSDPSATTRRPTKGKGGGADARGGAGAEEKASPANASPAKKAAADTTAVTAAHKPTTAYNPSPAPRPTAASQHEALLETLADPSDFHPADFADNTYHIRGGGTRHNRHTPLMVILIAVVVLVGIGLLALFFTGPMQELLGDKPKPDTVTLTAAQTREAIDSQMPRLIDNINYTAEEAYAVFTEAGWNVKLGDRMTSDDPDKSATGGEVIHLPPSIDLAVLDEGYYEGGFDAYDFDELQESFNGGWMLALSRGDSGAYSQIKYLNFAATSLEDELAHLRTLQGLDGGSSAVDKEGLDGFGNTYVQGYTVVEETTYFWKLIGIAFSEYYRGQDRRDLPQTAVFVKCTVASFDFYGAGTLPEDEPPVDETPAEESGGESGGEPSEEEPG
jgi:hypothetical protein